MMMDNKNEKIEVIKGKWKNEWIININGNEHTIYYLSNEKGSFGKLLVDGEQVEILRSSVMMFICFDQKVQIEGRIIHCVFNGESLDIAINGKYMKSQRDYVPLKKMGNIVLIAFMVLIILFILIGLDAPVIPSALFVFAIIVADMAYWDYLIKKAKDE